jgi:hypothetical protein
VCSGIEHVEIALEGNNCWGASLLVWYLFRLPPKSVVERCTFHQVLNAARENSLIGMEFDGWSVFHNSSIWQGEV